MNRKHKSVGIALLLAMLMVLLNIGSVFAATVQKQGNAPASTGNFTPVYTGNAGDANYKYEDPTNSFDDGNPKYYLATHDPSKANETTVEYNGEPYTLESVAVVEESFNFFNQTAKNGDRIFAYNGPSNITIFFDDGVYNDERTDHYTAFSRPNNSYIGLNKHANGESKVTISRNPRADAPVAGLMERYLLYRKNLYFENLKFSGKNVDMGPDKTGSFLIRKITTGERP